MLDEMILDAEDKSLADIMHTLADMIIGDLQEVQNSTELNDLLQHTDLEIRQSAVQIFDELGQLIIHLGKV